MSNIKKTKKKMLYLFKNIYKSIYIDSMYKCFIRGKDFFFFFLTVFYKYFFEHVYSYIII